MSTIDQLFVKLLSSDTTRSAFAADPRKMLHDAGADAAVVANMPAKIDPKVLDLGAIQVAAKLKKKGISVGDLQSSDAARLARVMGELQAEAQGRAGGTIASDPSIVVPTVTAVVPIVVLIVPVVVAAGQGRLAEAAGAPLSLSREGGQLTLHGPAGLKVTGLSIGDIAQVVKGVMN